MKILQNFKFIERVLILIFGNTYYWKGMKGVLWHSVIFREN